MAKLNGKTPVEIAKEIISEAIDPIMVEIDGVRGQELEELIRYKFSKKIYSKGEKWFERNLDALRQEFLESIIKGLYKTRKKADEEQEKKDVLEYYQLLQSKGMPAQEAAYVSGLVPRPEEDDEEETDAGQ